MDILQIIVHYCLHFLGPGVLAYLFFKSHWKKAWVIMVATMLVDLDHLYACKDLFPSEGGISFIPFNHFLACEEIFVAARCSIGFHPLHSYPAIILYFVLLYFPKTRIIAVGLLFHMLTDFQDCIW
jgi:hypothetical protein